MPRKKLCGQSAGKDPVAQVTDQGSTWGGKGFDIADDENPPFEGAYFIKKSFYKSITKVAISRVSRSFKEQRQIATLAQVIAMKAGKVWATR